jgi:hypothetical protein
MNEQHCGPLCEEDRDDERRVEEHMDDESCLIDEESRLDELRVKEGQHSKELEDEEFRLYWSHFPLDEFVRDWL